MKTNKKQHVYVVHTFPTDTRDEHRVLGVYSDRKGAEKFVSRFKYNDLASLAITKQSIKGVV